uniref:protein myomaker-like n=1 Tax=Myxine glutinosa TaxID=7769 RepID=UPI00358F00A9
MLKLVQWMGMVISIEAVNSGTGGKRINRKKWGKGKTMGQQQTVQPQHKLYHVCDGLGFISICIMHSELLEYFSTFGISLSIWVTLIAVGEFQEQTQLGTILAETLIIAVRTYENTWGYGVYAGPIITAITLLSIKFGRKMMKTRAVSPQRRVYTHQLAPGLCFLILAFTLRFYFQNWDYTYVHSAFHCSLAAACILLLPEKNKSATANRPTELTCCTLCCCP